MDKLVIEGNVPLRGRVRVSGSKNAALPILLAGLLVPQPVRLRNVPNLKDIGTTIKLLQLLGCEAQQDGHEVRILAGNQLSAEAPYELVRTMRASVLCLGPLLARLGKAVVALPGGCAIGSRPVDLHLRGLERMGARFDLNAGNIVGHCGQLHGAHIHFDFPTVGGTENLLMAASLARGETILENAAREPEVVNLADFLNACGANIQGQGTSIIRVQGVDELHEADFSIMPDRIEAGTYMVAAVITDGELYLENCSLADLDAVVYKLREMGVWLQEGRTGVLIRRGTKLEGVDVMTQPFPGFPTDMQAQIMALTGLASGSGVIKETIFENRFMHVQELVRMGAQIKVSGQNAMVRGVDHYTGAPVMASDLRASASLVLAGLAARGRTEVLRIYHLDRGYEQLEDKLSHVGARITRMKE